MIITDSHKVHSIKKNNNNTFYILFILRKRKELLYRISNIIRSPIYIREITQINVSI